MNDAAVLPTTVQPTATATAPFLKWVGGKRGLLPVMEPLLPKPEEIQGVGYREVCVGGGALFFGLYRDVRPAILSDDNPRLINVYVAVRDDLPTLLASLANYQEQFDACKTWDAFRATYMRIRAAEPKGVARVEVVRAAWLVAMNRTCMNGLYRENQSGVFNVGPGKWGKDGAEFRMPRLFDRARLEADSQALQGVRLVCSDFEPIIRTARKGELVFVDPPYVPSSDTANFTAYTKRGFSMATQERLRDAAVEAGKGGVRVALSNSDTPGARLLYSQFKIHTFDARRAINSDPTGRGPVKEILATTW